MPATAGTSPAGALPPKGALSIKVSAVALDDRIW